MELEQCCIDGVCMCVWTCQSRKRPDASSSSEEATCTTSSLHRLPSTAGHIVNAPHRPSRPLLNRASALTTFVSRRVPTGEKQRGKRAVPFPHSQNGHAGLARRRRVLDGEHVELACRRADDAEDRLECAVDRELEELGVVRARRPVLGDAGASCVRLETE